MSAGSSLLSERPSRNEGVGLGPVSCPAHAGAAAAGNPDPVFKFGRMFRDPTLAPYRPEPKDLIALGITMNEPLPPVGHASNIPAGYVYLGQFIDHDLTFDEKTKEMPSGEIEPEDEDNLRSPALDLDSLYGFDPAVFKQTELGRKIYDDDGIGLRVGKTGNDPAKPPGSLPSFPNDLKRQEGPPKYQTAMIADPRNDENLAVAQTHLAFIKFHNAVVNKLKGALSGEELFSTARAEVVRHYQWIILFDYLGRIVEESVLRDVIENGCKYLIFKDGEEPFMPVEFSVAAFRLGHSLISNTYEWNRIFQSKPKGEAVAELGDLFTFTGFGNSVFGNQLVLPSTWIVDWTRFYDFAGLDGIQNNPHSNSARKISPSVISPLMTLPPVPGETEPVLRSLPVRNLLRGRLLGLPSGQDVALRIQVQPLKPEEIKEKADAQRRLVLERTGFDQKTPLWYYILKEAEKVHDGERLGPVGSRIVAETFVALIKASRVSILPREGPGGPIWQPQELGLKPGSFSMPELLFFVQKSEGVNFLNPLGD